jgi:nicotinate-nucleotide--dimethylbenzimidazole phosphoribosyltransferase
MSLDGWRSVLVLGGIRSGKSEYAESLVGAGGTTGGPVRYVATGAARDDDPEWTKRLAEHQGRRPAGWATEEAGGDPLRLLELLGGADAGETLLVEDLGGWVTALLDPSRQPADDVATVADLAAAVASCRARLVLVSPEVGLSMVPLTPLGRAFADALGSTNQALARACDAVVLVVAGQPSWLKPTIAPAGSPPAGLASTAETTDEPAAAVVTVPAVSPEVLSPADAETPPEAPTGDGAAPPGDTWTAPTMTVPALSSGLVIQPGMQLPMPDEYEPPQARDRALTLDFAGTGLGNLAQVVGFAAGTQARTTPAPWRRPRAILVRGDHAGSAEEGVLPGESARRADLARGGEGPVARLAAVAGAELQVVDAPRAGAMEDGPVLSADEVESALRSGWRLAEEACDAGVDVFVVASCGAGAETAAAAVVAATTGAEAAAILPRVAVPGGEVDDAAWMSRCAAVRDALHRTRLSPRGAKEVLAELGGGDIAVATGLILGATARRVPVLLDGPVGVAAALVTRDLAGQARHWCLLPDHGGNPTVRLAADVLGLIPMMDLRVDLGEGTTALASLPLLRAALSLAASLPVHPALAPDESDDPGDGADGDDDAGDDAGDDAADEAGDDAADGGAGRHAQRDDADLSAHGG